MYADTLMTVISSIIAMIAGGGLIWVFTIKSTRQKARAEAMKEVQDVYQETIVDLREDKRLLKEEKEFAEKELAAQRERYSKLEELVSKLATDVQALKMKSLRDKCVNRTCMERIVE